MEIGAATDCESAAAYRRCKRGAAGGIIAGVALCTAAVMGCGLSVPDRLAHAGSDESSGIQMSVSGGDCPEFPWASRSPCERNRVARGARRISRVWRTLFGGPPRGKLTPAIVDVMDDCAIVAVTDMRGRIIHANKKFCEISGYSLAELLGKNHRLLNSGHHAKLFWRDMYRVVLSGQVWRAEVRNRAKDGKFYWVDTAVKAALDEQGAPRWLVAIRIDITASKEIEQKLTEVTESLRVSLRRQSEANEALDLARVQLDRQNIELRRAIAASETANRSQRRFIANMSHEIRTPLTAILGYAELLTLSDQSAEEVRDHGRRILLNGQHLLTVVSDILDMSKIQAGQMSVERVVCSPAQIVAEVIDLMDGRAGPKGLSLAFERLGSIPEAVETDPTRLRQILLNLVSNAIKFTVQGSVTIRLSAAPTRRDGVVVLHFDVVDSGIGIAREHLETIFQPFQQADDSTTRRYGGTGLGLAVSRELAVLLGGDLTVESVLGSGSTFHLVIQATTPQLEVRSGANALRRDSGSEMLAGAVPLAGCHVLLAEDGEDNQRLISFHLKRAGATVDVAPNGRIAVEMALGAEARHSRYHAVLMDMQMPELDGYGAARAIRAAGLSIPIIALTAHSMQEDRARCLDAGCNDYATKPLDRDRLLTIVRAAVSQSTAASVGLDLVAGPVRDRSPAVPGETRP